MNINEPPDPRSSMWAWIAYSLRLHRMQRGMSGDALAKLLNCARSSISRLENGEAKPTDAQAAILDKAWNTGGLFGVMLWYARLGHDPHWFKQFTGFEARASIMKTYDGQLIPALLQIPGYARIVEISRLPNVILRVVPNRAGATEGLDGPFKVITVREGQVGFVEAPNGGRLILDAAEIHGLTMRIDRIGAVALPVDASRSLIEQLMETMT